MRNFNVLTGVIAIGIVLSLSFPVFDPPAYGSPQVNIANAEAIFKEANSAYEKGDFASAAQAYHKLYDEGFLNGNLLYNLGNTYFKLGARGRAILFYERAQRLIPGDADLKANLNYALAEVQEGVPDWKQELLRYLTGIASVRQLIIAASILYFSLITLMIFWIIKPGPIRKIVTGNLKKWWFGVVLCCGITFLCCALMGILTYWDQSRQHAVAVKSDAVRFEPSPTATLYYNLDEGSRVLILEEKDNWVKLKRVDGKRGWVNKDCLEII